MIFVDELGIKGFCFETLKGLHNWQFYWIWKL